jgi:predicted GNAT family acetyltransferase
MAHEVVDDEARQRYELQLPGGVAFIDYTDAGKVRTFAHAEVPAALRGGGIAARLTGGALELAREQGLKVIARCPYVSSFIDRHPQYQDLLSR